MAGLAWLAAVVILLAYEFWALKTGRKTLSRFMWETGQKWPFFPALIGFVTGGLLVHFFWRWCDK
jgi:hypothetical protein